MYISFLINAFQSLDIEPVRNVLLRLVDMKIWHSVSENRLTLELGINEHWIDQWKKLATKQISKAEKEGRQFDASKDLEISFLKHLTEEFLEILDKEVVKKDGNKLLGSVNNACMFYCTRFIELLIDLLGQLPTRRFFKLIVSDLGVVPKCCLSDLCSHEKGKAFAKQVDLLRFYYHFPINDYTGMEMNEQDTLHHQYKKLLKFQLAVKKFPKLGDFSLPIIEGSLLKKQISILSLEELQSLACNELGLTSVLDPWTKRHDFLEEVIVEFFQKQPSLKDEVNSLAIYPTEEFMYHDCIFDHLNSSYAIPKLGLGFITISDLLFRSLSLLKLESAYEIRGDIEESLSKLVLGKISENLIPIVEVQMIEAKQPQVGEMMEATVKAQISFYLPKSVSCFGWNDLREGDHFLLVSLPPFEKMKSDLIENTVSEAFGINAMIGCELSKVHEKGKMTENLIRIDVKLDTLQIDRRDALYQEMNFLVRLKPKDYHLNSMKCAKKLLEKSWSAAAWLTSFLVGYGDSNSVTLSDNREVVECEDTFLDADHLKSYFADNCEVQFMDNGAEWLQPQPPFRISLAKNFKSTMVRKDEKTAEEENLSIIVNPSNRPCSQITKKNTIRFTPFQITAVLSGAMSGLTLIVGPPGTGKSGVTAEILKVIWQSCSEKILVLAPSIGALESLFKKVLKRNVPAKHLLLLGGDENVMALELSCEGHFRAFQRRQVELLQSVKRLAEILDKSDFSITSSRDADLFWGEVVVPLWERFVLDCVEKEGGLTFVKESFPFIEILSDVEKSTFRALCLEEAFRLAQSWFDSLEQVFMELREFIPLELLKSSKDKGAFMMNEVARIIGTTPKNYAGKMTEYNQNGFTFDNVLVDESAQMLEIENILPFFSQNEMSTTLKRIILVGDHHQLPPIVKSKSLNNYSNLEQSFFTRCIRLGVPFIELNAQGRCRPSIAELYSWKYAKMGNLPSVYDDVIFKKANAGFSHEYQLVDVPDQNRDKCAPLDENVDEAEYIASMYLYMRALGYESKRIAIITTYERQKALIMRMLLQICQAYSEPVPQVCTVDEFQGQERDFILLSLVRTRSVGHLRDSRRLIVAMSRARLGLYVFVCKILFEKCPDLQPTFKYFFQRSDLLALNLEQTNSVTDRDVEDTGHVSLVSGKADMRNILDDLLERKRKNLMMNS